LRRSEEALQRLAGRLITVQEEERRRIARELHDDLSQRLALHCVDLDLLRQSMPTGSEEARVLEQLRIDTDELVLDVRHISHNLHHPQLTLGLQHGAVSFCREFSEQHGISVDLTCEGDLKQIPETVSINLFRVLVDVSIPILDGTDVAKCLKIQGCKAKIVFISVARDIDQVKACFAAGGEAYVSKTQMATDLVYAVTEVLAGRTFVSSGVG
jgi:signal transduction histidine kinase